MAHPLSLVLVHGFMGGAAQWQLQAPLASDVGLVPVDLPGFGGNADAPVIDSITGFAKWVLAHLTTRGVERFHLLGHSMGGMIVQEMIRLAPERVEKLIIYGSGPTGNLPGRFESIETSKSRAVQDGVVATAQRISATWFLHREAAAEYPDCAEIACQSAAAALPAGLDAMQHWNGEAALSEIASETLIIWGDRDRTYKWPQVQTLWDMIPNASLAVLPQCAHAAHLEAPALFNHVLRSFLVNEAPPA